MTFRTLSGELEPTAEIPLALPWVHAASQPYIDWLLGGHSPTLRILDQWMRRPSSEVFVGRAVIAEQAGMVGGFIALSGAELAHCRMQDALAATAATTPELRPSLLERLRLGHALLVGIPPEDL